MSKAQQAAAAKAAAAQGGASNGAQDNNDQGNAADDGFARLYAPEGCSSCSFMGDSYDVANGVVEVPHNAVAELLPHGFTTSKETK